MRKTKVEGAWITTIVLVALAGCGGKAYEPYEREDTNAVTVPANNGVEFKLWMNEGDTVQYTWSASGRTLEYEFHGEPEGAAPGVFTSYKKSAGASDSGSKQAPFTGTHGWYWENKGTSSVTVSLKTSGIYDIVGETGKKH